MHEHGGKSTWSYNTEDKSRWTHSITSDRFVVLVTGGSLTIKDRGSGNILKRHSGHKYLYTGDISPDEKQCFALENGKHFYVYSLENYELIRRVTLPRSYDAIDVYGRYSEDGKFICIPAHRWVAIRGHEEGHYEYAMFCYDSLNFTLAEKCMIEAPSPYCWVQDAAELISEEEAKMSKKIMEQLSGKMEDEKFMEQLLSSLSHDTLPGIGDILSALLSGGK